VGEFENPFLMVVPTGFQPINSACCWQVGNLQESWKRRKKIWRNGTETKGGQKNVKKKEKDSSFPAGDL
jgi:hypothetical protein